MQTSSEKTKKTFVTAGAGAGKTTNLVGHILKTYAHYIKTYERAPYIIGTTFTRKAANEIKERVVQKSKETEGLDKEKLLDFAYSERLNITTIHGICLQILMKKAYLLGFSPKIEVASSLKVVFFQKRLLFNLLEQDQYSYLYKYFSFNEILTIINYLEEQKSQNLKLVTQEDLNEFYQNILQNYEPEIHSNILSFPERELLGSMNKPEAVIEIISEMKRALKESLDKNNFKPASEFFCSIYKSSTKKVNKNESLEKKYEAFKGTVKTLKVLLDKYYERRLNRDKEKENLKINSDLFKLYHEVSERVYTYKKEKSFVLMSDVEYLCLKVLKDFPEECRDYVDLWDYCYIDEYQDTSEVQKQIFDILLQGKNYYKVGDPQQSIYLFRGAQSGLFIEEQKKSLENPQVESLYLSKNYRSHPNLMQALNLFFSHIQISNQDIQSNFSDMDLREEPTSDESKRFQFILAQNMDEEIGFTSQEVYKLIKKGVPTQSICVLARSTKILNAVELKLAEMQIPCLAQFSGGLVSRPEWQGLIHFLTFVASEDDDEALIFLLRSQSFKVQDEDLSQWCAQAKEKKTWSLWSYLEDRDHKALEKLRALKSIFESQDYVEGLKSYFLHTTAFYAGYNEIDWERRKANLLKAFAFMCAHYENAGFSLEGLIEDLKKGKSDALSSEAVFAQAQNGVRLLTIHGSKGLEFEHVFVVGCGQKPKFDYTANVEVLEDKFFIPVKDKRLQLKYESPLALISSQQRNLQQKKELRRLIYVAATRAKENLYLSGSFNSYDKLEPESVFAFSHITDLIKAKDHPLWQWADLTHLNSATKSSKDKEELKDEGKKKSLPSNKNLNEKNFLSFEDFEKHRDDYWIKNKSVYDFGIKAEALSLKSPRRFNNISVSALVEKITSQQSQLLQYKTVNQVNFQKLDMSFLVNFEHKLNHQMQIFLKPFIGDVFHKAMELYAKGLPKDSLRDYLQAYFQEAAEEVLNLIENVAEIQNPSMSEVLNKSYSEWGFNSLLKGNNFISGQIDLWGWDRQSNLHVIDYKTGSAQHIDKAACQLALYKEVLKLRYPQANIFTHVIYLSQGKFLSLDIQPIDCTQVE